jgi:hypothetical protein
VFEIEYCVVKVVCPPSTGIVMPCVTLYCVPLAATEMELRKVNPAEPEATDIRLLELAPVPSEYMTAFQVLYSSALALIDAAVVARVVLFVVITAPKRRNEADTGCLTLKFAANDTEPELVESTTPIFGPSGGNSIDETCGGEEMTILPVEPPIEMPAPEAANTTSVPDAVLLPVVLPVSV